MVSDPRELGRGGRERILDTTYSPWSGLEMVITNFVVPKDPLPNYVLLTGGGYVSSRMECVGTVLM